jgi:hypothetical protein
VLRDDLLTCLVSVFLRSFVAGQYPDEAALVAEELRTSGAFGPGAWGVEGRLAPERCPSPEALAAMPRLNAFINEVGD